MGWDRCERFRRRWREIIWENWKSSSANISMESFGRISHPNSFLAYFELCSMVNKFIQEFNRDRKIFMIAKKKKEERKKCEEEKIQFTLSKYCPSKRVEGCRACCAGLKLRRSFAWEKRYTTTTASQSIDANIFQSYQIRNIIDGNKNNETGSWENEVGEWRRSEAYLNSTRNVNWKREKNSNFIASLLPSCWCTRTTNV